MFILNPRLAADVFDGEYIIANLDTGLYYSIQGIAVSLVAALPFETPQPHINLLADAFPLNATSIHDELNDIFQELVKEEIIKEGHLTSNPVATSCSPPDQYIPSRFNRYADMQDLLLLDPIHEVDEEGWAVQNKEEKKD